MGRRQAARSIALALRGRQCTSQQGILQESFLQSFEPYIQQSAVAGAPTRYAVGVAQATRQRALPIRENIFGAVSQLNEGESYDDITSYQNIDGMRIDDGRYTAFIKEISDFIPQSRQFTDPVRTFAYGTDASFYRLNPKLVVKIHNEEEVQKILPIARKHSVPITFRAAGTSLSGQALTDSVLLKLSHTGKNFRNYQIHGDGSQITVEPGLIGGEINRILANFAKKNNQPVQYKIGPDPSSIDSCMVGGIVSNNSSGMCCGVSQNTYHTLKDMRMVMADGTVLDTADQASRESFLKTHKALVEGVSSLARRVQQDRVLVNLIRRKFAIKCTTGYSLNALVDFCPDDPIEIIKRLMIGSEGTFGFISRVTYNTVPDLPHKASAFIMFPDVRQACLGAAVLRNNTCVDAVELFDRASLTECGKDEEMTALVPDIIGAGPAAASLLIECRGQTPEGLQERIDEVQGALSKAGLQVGSQPGKPGKLEDYPFKHDPKDWKVYWDCRKGLIPIVGGAREVGTAMLIEDVACPVDNLEGMMVDLIDMFQKYEYKDASCFGHALEGNLHLVFSQGFRTPEEVARFGAMMDEMCYIVATKHSGSLKGEHGTGRNVAPYVEMEWGTKAYNLMWELKELFDPDNVINPGVVLNTDPNLHMKNLKPSPAASSLINRCIECGFCESNCPSRDITLTPRQRITVYREMSRLKAKTSRTAEEEQRLKAIMDDYVYQGDATCAADGMCQEKCPVKINTGDLVKSMRAEALAEWRSANNLAQATANNFGYVTAGVPALLNTVSFFHSILGAWPLQTISNGLNRVTYNYVPTWNPFFPRGAKPLKQPAKIDQPVAGLARKVVYLPSCVTQMMGPSLSDKERDPVHYKLLSLFEKGGYEVVYPEGVKSLCCGMLYNTRGFKEAAATKGADVEAALMVASDNGKIPIVVDTSPCLAQIKTSLKEPALRFALYDPVEFIRLFLTDKLEFSKVKDNVAVHVPCSSSKMGIGASFVQVAGMCAHNVHLSGVPCCGMAGDRGMRYPELTAAATQHMSLPPTCADGYSTSRTCEMAMSKSSGIDFRGLVYLVDEATKAKPAARASVQ